MEEGTYHLSEKSGTWNYYDSSGHLERTEWYSNPEWNEGFSHCDSTCWYYTDGRSKKFQSEVLYPFTCYQHNSKKKGEPGWKPVKEERQYYDNGNVKSQRFTVSPPCEHYEFKSDTFEVTWYGTGELHKVDLYTGDRFEYFTNGKLKSRRRNISFYPRDGIYFVGDSLGNTITDRTYDDGKLLAARDSAFTKIDTSRVQLAEKLKGIAAISLYPMNQISAGGNRDLFYYHSDLPGWKDSTFIPQAVIDSIAYIWAGALQLLPDSLKDTGDSLLAMSESFHPNDSTWYYTVVMEVGNYYAWTDSLLQGHLRTRNTLADQYFSHIDYEIISWSTSDAYTEQGLYGYVVIKTNRPLNFLAFHHALFDPERGRTVSVYCGKQQEMSPQYEVYASRATFKSDFMHVSIRKRWSGNSRKYTQMPFVVNSDNSVDLSGVRFGELDWRVNGRYIKW